MWHLSTSSRPLTSRARGPAGAQLLVEPLHSAADLVGLLEQGTESGKSLEHVLLLFAAFGSGAAK